MIDAHLHWTDERFDPDREKLLEQAHHAGVSCFLSASARPDEWRKLIEFSRRHKSVLPFIGTHPWYASSHNDALFKNLLIRFPETGVGEIGLDAIKGDSEQERVFTAQLDVAAELNRPCVIHCVKRFDKTAEILKALKKRPPALMFHGFSGTVQQATFLNRFNAYFSFSGAVLQENREKLRSVLTALPCDRILIETDAPDLIPPERFRLPDEKGRNLPASLPLIVEGIAAVKGIDSSLLIPVLKENVRRFLRGK